MERQGKGKQRLYPLAAPMDLVTTAILLQD